MYDRKLTPQVWRKRAEPMNYRPRCKFAVLLFVAVLSAYGKGPSSSPSTNCDTRTKGEYCVDVSRVATTGDQVRGPVTIRLKNVNILQYDVKLGETITYP